MSILLHKSRNVTVLLYPIV